MAKNKKELLIEAALFDLDGVLVSTDRLHYQAWKQLADEEGIYFDNKINHRLRGVSRAQSLDIILERSPREYTAQQKLALCNRKNKYFKDLIKALTPEDWLDGAKDLLLSLRSEELKLALCSSSRNAQAILERLQGQAYFDEIVDGNEITRTKPDPQIFELAAERLRANPKKCVVFEDANSGVQAAKSAGMYCVGIGDENRLQLADIVLQSLCGVSGPDLLDKLLNSE